MSEPGAAASPATAGESFKRSLVFAALAMAPIAVLVAIKVFAVPRPYWAFFFDPEVIFYFSGIDILEGRPPSNTDHPGTTLEILTAAITAITGRSALDIDAFRPAAYWTAFAVFAAGLAAGLIYAAVRRAVKVALPIAFAAAGTAAGFFVATIPALSRYPKMFGFVSAQVAHSGMYGHGPAEAPQAHEVASNFAGVVRTATLWHAWLGLVAIAATWGLLRARRELRTDPLYGATMILGLVAAVLGYAAIVRTGNVRYLLVSGVASIAIVAATVRSLDARSWRAPGLALGSVAGILLALCLKRDVADQREWIAACTGQRTEILRRIAELRPGIPGPVVVYGRRAPDPAYALGVYVSTQAQRADVHRRFPSTGWFNPWHPNFVLPPGVTDWDLLVMPEADIDRLPFAPGPRLGHVGEFVILGRR